MSKGKKRQGEGNPRGGVRRKGYSIVKNVRCGIGISGRLPVEWGGREKQGGFRIMVGGSNVINETQKR